MKKVLSLFLSLVFICLSVGSVSVLASDLNYIASTPSGIPFSELESRIDELVIEHIGITTPGSAIVVVHEGEIIFSQGYGYADIDNDVPFHPATTISRHGSINKLFVWTAAMQLVDRGLLDLDVDITAYLSYEDVRLFSFEKSFTMRDLMNHSAGFADIFFDLQGVHPHDWQDFNTRDGLLVSQPNQIFVPGTASAYSNWGTAFAGYVVSQISGLSFADYNFQNILSPAGMENTLDEPFWAGNHDFVQNLAVGHEPRGNGSFREQPVLHLGGLYPAGSSMSTAEDLARFIIALTPEQGDPGPLFQNRATLETMFTLSSPDPIYRPSFYHGFVRSGVMNSIGHSGGILGYVADVSIVPEERFGWVIMVNSNSMEVLDLVVGLTHLLAENTAGQVLSISDNLPDASAVQGRFISLRRTHNTFLDFMTYMGSIRITALDENTIRMSLADYNADFVQIEPYVFRLVSSDELAMYTNLSELRFRMENGEPVHIYATGADFTALPIGRTMPFLVLSIVIIVASVLFFLTAPIVLLVSKIRGKAVIKNRFYILSNAFIFSGTVLLLNNIILIVRTFSEFLLRTSAEVMPHIWINYMLGTMIVGLFVMSLLAMKQAEIRAKRKLVFCASSILIAFLLATLFHWNFFSLL